VQSATKARSRRGCGKLVLNRGQRRGSIGVLCMRGRALLNAHARTAQEPGLVQQLLPSRQELMALLCSPAGSAASVACIAVRSGGKPGTCGRTHWRRHWALGTPRVEPQDCQRGAAALPCTPRAATVSQCLALAWASKLAPHRERSGGAGLPPQSPASLQRPSWPAAHLCLDTHTKQGAVARGLLCARGHLTLTICAHQPRLKNKSFATTLAPLRGVPFSLG